MLCLLIGSLQPGTGNYETALRIGHQLQPHFSSVVLQDCHKDLSPETALLLESKSGAGFLLIGLHAYRAGLFIQRHGLLQHPALKSFILMLGGTDINEVLHGDEGRSSACAQISAGAETASEMVKAMLQRADAVVAFTEAMAEKSQQALELCKGGSADMTEEKGRTPLHKACSGYDRCYLIPQAVDVLAGGSAGRRSVVAVEGSARTMSMPATTSLRSLLGIAEQDLMLLLPAGLRAVKRPLFLKEALQEWNAAVQTWKMEGSGAGARDMGAGTWTARTERSSGGSDSLKKLALVLVGPPLDAVEAKQVQEATHCAEELILAGSAVDTHGPAGSKTEAKSVSFSAVASSPYGGAAGLFYHPAVPRSQMLQWMQEADAVCNSSDSEGQSNAVLEALGLGCTVLARRNEGNCSLLEHGRTGLLFDTAQQGLAQLLVMLQPQLLLPAPSPSAPSAASGPSSSPVGLLSKAFQDAFQEAIAAAPAMPPVSEMQAAAQQRVRDLFSMEAEREAWERLLKDVGLIAKASAESSSSCSSASA